MHTQANKTMHDSGLHFAPGWKECSDKDGRTKKKSFSMGDKQEYIYIPQLPFN